MGLFESCEGTGDPGFNPTENPGTIRDITVAYNVVLDSKWMCLAQIVNTIHENVVFEHKRSLGTSSSTSSGTVRGLDQNCEKNSQSVAPESGANMCPPVYSHSTTG